VSRRRHSASDLTTAKRACQARAGAAAVASTPAPAQAKKDRLLIRVTIMIAPVFEGLAAAEAAAAMCINPASRPHW
jgi:hypothetical protein